MSERKKHFETIAIRQRMEKHEREHSSPLYPTSSFTYESAEQARALFADEEKGNMYSRFSNPNTDEFIQKMAALEGTEDGFATASGMAAVFASIVSLLQQGDHIVAARALFGSTHQTLTKILPKWGIEHTYIDGRDPQEWKDAIRSNTKMFLMETPSNPGLRLIDIEAVNTIAHKNGILTNIDNCFATPYLQRPAEFGTDIIVHSATKWIDGQGRVVGGIVLASEELIKDVRFFCRQTGPAMSPFNAWILSKSLETLAVRMDRHCANAERVAEGLRDFDSIDQVLYPFASDFPQQELAKKQMDQGGGLVTFILKGGYEKGKRFIDNLRMLSHTANLGDTRSIVTHPASTTHAKLTEEERAAVGIGDGLVRISVGLEHPEDILEDLSQAIEKA
jgi:O-succinylhomoserine sulfhydrylase